MIMSDFIDDLNKAFKKDLVPFLVKYIKDPDIKISENVSNILNNPEAFFNDIFRKFSKTKENITTSKDYSDIENIIDIDEGSDIEYEDLYIRLKIIEENLMQMQKLLRGNN